MLTSFRLSLLCAIALPLAPSLRAAAPPLTVATGFKVEQIHKTDLKTEGSWVSLCVDEKGDLIASDQYGYLWRIVPPAIGKTEGTKVEKVKINAGKAHGLLWAFGSLYVMGSDKPGEPDGDMRTLWRAWDSKGDGTFDQMQRIASFEAPGEHGPHALVLSPNGQKIYFACGNHTPTPKFDRSRDPLVWQEDQLLPRMWDANGHARGIMAPGGFIARCNPDGSDLELVASGFRNEYDFAFNQNGEMFTYDADMEWDLGLPWYRPTRVCHVASGSRIRLALRLGQMARLLRGQPPFGARRRPRLADRHRLRHGREVPRQISERAVRDGLVLRHALRGASEGERRLVRRGEGGLHRGAIAAADRSRRAPAGWRALLHRGRAQDGERALSRDLHRQRSDRRRAGAGSHRPAKTAAADRGASSSE